MTLIGRIMLCGTAIAAWLAALGAWSPTLDAFASLLPVFAALLLLGLLMARRGAWWTLPIAALGLTPMAVAATREAARTIPAAAADTARLRVLTHNVWVDNAGPATTGAAIAGSGADVVLLQETTRARAALIATTRARFPYRTACPGNACGLTILSRWPIVSSGYFLTDRRGHKIGPPLLWADVAVPGMATVRLATVHYPWPLPADAQARRRRALSAALAQGDRTAMIVAGDMNLTPWGAAMRAQDRALAPLTRMTRAIRSWPSALPFLPIDQLYAGPAWGLERVERLAATGSDHRPLLITLGRR